MPIRIGGLASGMDIDSIVNDLMRVERMRVDKEVQNRTLLEWTRDKYNEVNKMLANFVLDTRTAFGLTDSSSGVLLNKSVSSLKWIKSAAAADESIVDVSARPSALNGSYNITVERLASNWSSASSGNISIGEDRSNIKSQFNLENSDVIYFTITSNEGLKNEGKVRVYISSNEVSIRVKNEQGENKITLDGKNLSNVSLKEIADQINKADIGVTALYDESIDRFFLQTNETGKQSTIKITDEGKKSIIGLLQLQYDDNGTAKNVVSGDTYKGQDAKIHFGMARDIEMSSNQFTINNIDINLKAVGTTTIKVDTDEDSVIEKIKEFVNQYNELIDKLDGILGEKRYRDYLPLTEEQKEAMSEKEIELWEERAKSGLLRNDQVISSTMQNIRLGLYEGVKGVAGAFSHLTDIGIETESYTSGSMGGKLKIDENKLRAAIREDIDGVVELLFKEPDKNITDEKERRQNTGLVGRMYGDLISGMKQVITKAGPGKDAQLYRNVQSNMLLDFVTEHSSISMLDKSINDYSKRVAELERRLMDKENAYWKKFTAMEKALNNMYSQSMWLAQQLGMN